MWAACNQMQRQTTPSHAGATALETRFDARLQRSRFVSDARRRGKTAMIKLITLHFVAVALGSGATLAVAYTWCM
jgi:hypothetical protein